jgi:hypothetical protein
VNSADQAAKAMARSWCDEIDRLILSARDEIRRVAASPTPLDQIDRDILAVVESARRQQAE